MLSGKTLNFREFRESGEFLVKDVETGTAWDPITGVALEGPLKGRVLERVESHYEFWFAWKDFRPETELFQRIE